MPKDSSFIIKLDRDGLITGHTRGLAGHVLRSGQRFVTAEQFKQIRRGAESIFVPKSNYQIKRWKHTEGDSTENGLLKDLANEDDRPTAAWASTIVDVRVGARNVQVELKIDGPVNVTELNFFGFDDAFSVVLQSDGAGKRKWLMDVNTSISIAYRLDNCTEVRMTNSLKVTVA